MIQSAIQERIRSLLERISPFDLLTEAQRDGLLADLSIQFYEPGEVVVEQGSTVHRGLYIVESGLVRLMDVQQHRLLDKCGEGELFGSFGLIKGGAQIYEAKAVEPTVCALLKGEAFQKLYDANEAFAAFFNQDIKQYLNRLGTAVDVAGAHLLMSRRLHQFDHRPLVTCTEEITAQQAARKMRREDVSTLVVLKNGRPAGLLTDRDLRNKIVARGQIAEVPVRRIMSKPVYTIAEGANLLEAMKVMLGKAVTRLVILREEEGEEVPVGLLTDRDLAYYRGQDPIATRRRIEKARSADELAGIRKEIDEQLLLLYRQGVPPEVLDEIVCSLYDRIVSRVLVLAEKILRVEQADDRVDLPWAWLRLGNTGRQETALTSERFGAILYANPAPGVQSEKAERWFCALLNVSNALLDACGFSTGDDAAPDLQRYLSLRAWKKAYRTWIFQSDEAELTLVPPFFDLRRLQGEESLVEALVQDIIDALNVQAMDEERAVLEMLARLALERKPPLSFLKRFVVERSGEHRNAFDIYTRGVRPVVDLARVLALDLRYFESTNTLDRLRHAADAWPEQAETLIAAYEAYQFLVDFRLSHRLRAVEANEPPSDHIDPATLTRIQRNLLRAAFRAIADLQDTVAARFGKKRKLFS